MTDLLTNVIVQTIKQDKGEVSLKLIQKLQNRNYLLNNKTVSQNNSNIFKLLKLISKEKNKNIILENIAKKIYKNNKNLIENTRTTHTRKTISMIISIIISNIEKNIKINVVETFSKTSINIKRTKYIKNSILLDEIYGTLINNILSRLKKKFKLKYKNNLSSSKFVIYSRIRKNNIIITIAFVITFLIITLFCGLILKFTLFTSLFTAILIESLLLNLFIINRYKIIDKTAEKQYFKIISQTLKLETSLINARKESMKNLKLAKQNRTLLQKIKSNYREMIMALSLALDERDHYTAGHSERVTIYAIEIAKQLNLSKQRINNLKHACILHDIGKLGLKENILNKPGKLTDQEYEHIKMHPMIANYILSPIIDLRHILPFILYHHERWDGLGYPDKLIGPSIPLESRILSICDTFDAITSDRPYRKTLSVNKAISILKNEKGKQFDPIISDIMIKLIKSNKFK